MAGKRKEPYLNKIGERDDITIWRVDGAFIRKNLDEEFNNFGQHYRFNFIPENEFWIEKETGHDETSFFIDHLLVEHRLMKDGVPYNKALTAAEKVEKKERHRAESSKDHKHKFLGMGQKKPDPRSMHERMWRKMPSGVKVWIVNGKRVRSDFDIEFTEGGHHEVYGYVPEGEVWIDDAVPPKERSFILLHETHELRLMEMGLKYDKAHAECSRIESYYRHHPKELKGALKENEETSVKD